MEGVSTVHDGDHGSTTATPTQVGRKHILIVNSSPEFLDLARVLLQGERYNVTTTNVVPFTYQMISSGRPDVVVIDLAGGEGGVWRLVRQVAAGPRTARIPLVLVSDNGDLLDKAESVEDGTAGGRFLVLRPFDVQILADTVHALVGPA